MLRYESTSDTVTFTEGDADPVVIPREVWDRILEVLVRIVVTGQEMMPGFVIFSDYVHGIGDIFKPENAEVIQGLIEEASNGAFDGMDNVIHYPGEIASHDRTHIEPSEFLDLLVSSSHRPGHNGPVLADRDEARKFMREMAAVEAVDSVKAMVARGIDEGRSEQRTADMLRKSGFNPAKFGVSNKSKDGKNRHYGGEMKA